MHPRYGGNSQLLSQHPWIYFDDNLHEALGGLLFQLTIITIIIVVILEFEPRTSHMLGKHSATGLPLKLQIRILTPWSKAITKLCSHSGS